MPVKVVERKPLTWIEKTYIPQILSGLKVTLKSLFKPVVTLQYPEERPKIPDGYRGVPTLVKDPDGREKCVSCQLCEFVCPSKAIRIEPGEIAQESKNMHIEKAPKKFEINMLRCIYCGLCQEVCPEEAIFLQKTYSLSSYSRNNLVLQKQDLYKLGGVLPDKHYKWERKEKNIYKQKDAEIPK
jgi:NADH-quinone oxidoreductase subunit I